MEKQWIRRHGKPRKLRRHDSCFRDQCCRIVPFLSIDCNHPQRLRQPRAATGWVVELLAVRPAVFSYVSSRASRTGSLTKGQSGLLGKAAGIADRTVDRQTLFLGRPRPRPDPVDVPKGWLGEAVAISVSRTLMGQFRGSSSHGFNLIGLRSLFQKALPR